MLKARLLPLSGKFYGSQIVIADGSKHPQMFEVWVPGPDEGLGTPSKRQYESDGCSSAEKWMAEGWADSHMETDFNYKVAQACVDGINAMLAKEGNKNG